MIGLVLLAVRIFESPLESMSMAMQFLWASLKIKQNVSSRSHGELVIAHHLMPVAIERVLSADSMSGVIDLIISTRALMLLPCNHKSLNHR